MINNTAVKVTFVHMIIVLVTFVHISNIAKLSQAKPKLQLSWLALASLNFT